MQAFLWAAHAVHAGAQIAAATLLRDWHPLDELKPLHTQTDANKTAAAGAAAAASSAAQPSPPAVAPLSALEQAQRSGRSLPLTHARSRPGLVLQLACALLALLACTRVLPQAGRELRVATATHFSTAGASAVAAGLHPRGVSRRASADAADAVGPPGARNAPQHAEDLIPIQRGGRRTVREIMEQDVAHLLPGRLDSSAPARLSSSTPQPPQALKHGRVFSAQEQRAAESSPALIRKEDDGSALGGVVFHTLGLLLSLFHWSFYAGWSRLNPQRRWSAPGHLALSRRASTHFRATTVMGLLMAFVNTLALYCLLRAGTDADWEEGGALQSAAAAQAASSSRYAGLDDPLGAAVRDVSSVSPTGLLTALCYFPYFMLHLHRFALNVVLAWRFRSFFPRVGTAANTRRGKRADATAVADGALPADLRKQRAAARRRRAAEEDAAGADDMDGEEFDLSELVSLASYAPDSTSGSSPSSASIAAALALDPSGDSLMAPSPLMEKLRNTPKLEQLRLQEQRQRKKDKEMRERQANKEE